MEFVPTRVPAAPSVLRGRRRGAGARRPHRPRPDWRSPSLSGAYAIPRSMHSKLSMWTPQRPHLIHVVWSLTDAAWVGSSVAWG
eukprot:gene2968-biopygen2100